MAVPEAEAGQGQRWLGQDARGVPCGGTGVRPPPRVRASAAQPPRVSALPLDCPSSPRRGPGFGSFCSHEAARLVCRFRRKFLSAASACARVVQSVRDAPVSPGPGP